MVAGLSLVSATLAAPALFGCTIPEKFDPSGGDVAVNASWTVNGGAAAAESCADACIGSVELRVWEEYEGGEHYTQDGWRVDCATGSLVTQPLLVPDTYRIGLYGLRALPDMGVACEDSAAVRAAGIQEVTAEAAGTVSVMLDLSPAE